MLETLRRLRLLKEDGERLPALSPDAHATLLRLCDEGVLEGGLSVATGVTPDELLGPLTLKMGVPAGSLRVHDVRGERPMVLDVEALGRKETWSIDGVHDLIDQLNALYRGHEMVRSVQVLGEWNDMLQLWCVQKKALPVLQKERLLPAR